ncbi:flagellar assembly protein FliW [Schinkia azotoformans]|uniref:flagellar assembly protein FliW n=1 Tax=Schinkia azotoformans TaxID=1454 RepID=UPI002DB74874|nr:flagellar assembly protein FliW [Schinkia azotoformans]MEC1770237.1 flagellar assembly protein FliW [Schinkia azotoformans]MED4365671.1 flagellar assembly protein FliW [Schinkia azotoformans]
MEINTKYHGEMEIEDKAIIQFKEGIPSFEDEKQFVIIPLDEDSPFLILQSLTTPSLGFVIINPFDYFTDYTVDLSESTIQKLKIKSEDQVAIYTILTVQEPFENTTTNLSGPIVINVKDQLGKQIILNNEKYTTKHYIINTPTAVSKERK